MSTNTLVLITSQFPFGTGEPFLETELKYLVNEFDKVIIISQNYRLKRTKSIPDKISVHRYNSSTSLSGFILLPFLLMLNFNDFISMFRTEVIFRSGREKTLTTGNVSSMIRKIIKALQLKSYIKNVLVKENVSSNIIFYSYWLNSGALAISLLDYKDSVKISRAHGSDLYEEKTATGYLPHLRYLSDNLDAIFFISEDGFKYFTSKTGAGKAICHVSRLGVKRIEENIHTKRKDECFRIVSCSNLIPLKRIDIIINALEKTISERKICWVHFGDGPLKTELLGLAAKKLTDNNKIVFDFKGQVPNKEIHSYYISNNVDIFINTSISEGAPVSIMEAQSYGILVVATDVGGVNELVNDTTGFLLPADVTPDQLSSTIMKIINLPEEVRESYGNAAYSNWKFNYNESVNYPDFIKKVSIILAQKITNCLPDNENRSGTVKVP